MGSNWALAHKRSKLGFNELWPIRGCLRLQLLLKKSRQSRSTLGLSLIGLWPVEVYIYGLAPWIPPAKTPARWKRTRRGGGGDRWCRKWRQKATEAATLGIGTKKATGRAFCRRGSSDVEPSLGPHSHPPKALTPKPSSSPPAMVPSLRTPWRPAFPLPLR